MIEDVVLRIESGALAEVPCFEHDECGRNWCAVIEDKDCTAPGGFRRWFLSRASLPFFYIIEGVERGDVIEFGADRVSLKHPERKQPRRAHGVVQEVTETFLRYKPAVSALAALAESRTPAYYRERPVRRNLVRHFRDGE